MKHISASTSGDISILDLPTVLTTLCKRAQYPLLPGVQAALFIRYLRRKPGRGLTVTYTIDELHALHQRHLTGPTHSVSLTLDEQALNGAHIRFTMEQVQQLALTQPLPGILHAPGLGLSVQIFPADIQLPTLLMSCDTTPSGPLFEALQSAARLYLQNSTYELVSAQAEPVRYKPGNRCVMRYTLRLANANHARHHTLLLFGKVYADPAQARNVHFLQEQLFQERRKTGEIPYLPRPLGRVDALGLTLNEAIQPASTDEQLYSGTQIFQPRIERGRGGVVTRVIIPEEELQITAQALARLHTSMVHPDETMLRTGAKEARRARERAALLTSYTPTLAESVQRLTQQLSALLTASQPDMYRPAHGGFKSSQLLFHSGHVFVVDFDGFCLADPALDVGYFLAYLRPGGLWYNSPGTRLWFEAAANVFRVAYLHTMFIQGVAHPTVDGILDRTPLYEAALLLKIATRRVNRLNSARPQELEAILREIATCLSRGTRRS